MSSPDSRVHPKKSQRPSVANAGLSGEQCGTFHVILTEELEIALDLSPAAQAYQQQATAAVLGRAAAEHPEELHLRSGNRRAITVAVIAQICSMDGMLAQSGLCLLAVLTSQFVLKGPALDDCQAIAVAAYPQICSQDSMSELHSPLGRLNHALTS